MVSEKIRCASNQYTDHCIPVKAAVTTLLPKARNWLSKVFNRALKESPQRISRRGNVDVLIYESEYQQSIGERQGLAQYLHAGPTLDSSDLKQDETPTLV